MEYRKFKVYEEKAMPGRYRTSIDEGQKMRKIYDTKEGAKRDIDLYYKKQEGRKQMELELKQEAKKNKERQTESLKNSKANAVKKVTAMRLREEPTNAITTVYYADDKGKRHGIQIKRIRGKLFQYKHGRKKAVKIYYSELFKRLATIAHRYDTGRWT